jgi:oxygen-independent coproporphyrinogen-3 oxidase
MTQGQSADERSAHLTIPVRNLRRYTSTNVPRYTSYPTAPHFKPSIDAAVYTQWLEQTAPDTPTSLYLHVPYCRAICAYCGCFTKASRKDKPILTYGNLLAREIELVTERIPTRLPVKHMHWGGGTPSLMPAEGMQAILSAIAKGFDLSAVEEHAIELDPRVVTQDLAHALKSYGVTRVSLGVQDLNAQVQQAIGRVQPLEVVQRAMDMLRIAGLNAINTDVMYGLPNQTLEDVIRTVTACAALGADRIALFGYAHVPWMKKNQKLIQDDALPSAGVRLEQARAAHKALEHLGYESVGFDHFARPEDPMAKAVRNGTLRRNFQGYTTDTAPAMIGFGASSIGHLPQGYAQNIADIGAWSRAIESGNLAIARGYEMRDEDKLRASIIEELLTGFSTDLSRQRAGITPSQHWINEQIIRLDDLVDDGLCEVLGSTVTVPESARFLSRLVASRFDGFLDQGRARHSAAI